MYLRARLLDFITGNNTQQIVNRKWIVNPTSGGQKEVLPYISYYENQFMRLEGTYQLISKLLPAYKHFSSYTSEIKSIKKEHYKS